MIIQGRLLDSNSTLESEFCVIGTGMGGSALAQALARAGKNVLMVEAGSLAPENGGPPAIRTETVGRPFGLPVTRCIEVGGSSNRWHGICGVLDEIDFEPRPWVRDSGWPVRYADLSPHYAAAVKEMGIVADGDFDPGRIRPPFRERLGDIDFNRSVLRNKMVEVHEPPRRWKGTVASLCGNGKVRCVVNAPALELVTNAGGNRVEALLAGGSNGAFRVKAGTFVVSAGALETPRLLLNSRGTVPCGLGNSSGMAGRYLLDHPIGHFCKLGFGQKTKAPVYASQPAGEELRLMAGLMVSPERQKEHGLPNHYLWMRPSVSPKRVNDELLLSFLAVRSARDLSVRQATAILTNADIRYRILVHRFGLRPTYRYADLFFMTEQLPNPRSCVRLSERVRDRYGYPAAQIDWQLTEADFRGFEAYAKLLFGEGLRSPSYRIAREDPIEVWERTVTGAAHHLGTARMARTPYEGVVDPNLRVFGVDNLYVCDGSVFTTAGAVNPSLTIVALALRLGERLLR